MKIIHVTPWYPNPENPMEALWIKRHIQSLAGIVDQRVLHISVDSGKWFRFRRHKTSSWEEHLMIRVPTRRWFAIELIWFIALSIYLVNRKVNKKEDLIQFHISYPSLVYWHVIKRFIRVPVLILEHWSAFHYHFGVRNIHKLRRIKRIFRQKIPVVAVSGALLFDLERFSGTNEFKHYILPNVVDTDVFCYDDKGVEMLSRAFFMVSQWNWPKDPLLSIRAFVTWEKDQAARYTLRIGGYGKQWESMIKLVSALGAGESVVLLGKITSKEIAAEMNSALGFIHCSEYETFSVVCAEALCCGTPVLGSGVGGINELVNEHNGILVEEQSEYKWKESLTRFVGTKYDRKPISDAATKKYCMSNVGRRYVEIINEIVNGTDG